MKRTIIKQLQQWKNNKKRKPLIILGARQVGKTYSLMEFAKSKFKNLVYLNFENTPRLKRLFSASLQPQEILRAIAIEMSINIDPKGTLIIFDEIQECPEALISLKYFCELASNYYICGAGSLLGVKLTKGFPVGKVNLLHLYPLTFLEFLDAIGQFKLKQYVEKIDLIKEIPDNLHEKLLGFFSYYLYIGGMPEAIVEYIDSANLTRVRSIQQDILQTYSMDFSKHAPEHNIMKINQVWDSIPGQLSKENKKFIYSIIRKGARAKDFEIAIQWLYEAGLIHKVYNVETPKLPLEAYTKFEIFKLYTVDVGLLGAKANLAAKTILDSSQLFQEFRGALIENFIMQELVCNNYKLYYWTSAGKAELDIVLQQQETIYPIEVKSGYSNKKKSLKVYTDKYKPTLAIRMSPKNLRKDGRVLNCPLYLAGRLPQLIDFSTTQY